MKHSSPRTSLRPSPRRSIQLCICFLLVTSFVAGDEFQLEVRVIDAKSKTAVPARLYLKSQANEWYYFDTVDADGSAVHYTKQNWINKRSVEYHTTVSAHPCRAEIPAGEYALTVESGKSYFPREVQVAIEANRKLTVELTRWNNPAIRGWYSGDTHLHREIEDLKNVIAAEDLNVALPLTNWVTISNKPPAAGDKNLTEIPTGLVKVDEQHVIWPRNTEYEIFSVAGKRHTLGALFVLGHRDGLGLGVPPWKPVIESVVASDPNVLFDMDKLDWPFAMLLPTIAPNASYELANNHVWRTEFAFRKWNTAARPYMQPPHGATEGGHRQWLDYTMGMYYTLLNCGFRLPPSAGTANGVHPVPAGFGRVYVHLPDGFQFDAWMKALKAGRSFVTTGPMLYATANGKDPGHVFVGTEPKKIELEMDVVSEQPISYGEVLVNGRPEVLLRPANQKTDVGAFRSTLNSVVNVHRSGWVAIRFWEPRPDGQSRFVHSAPWYVEVDGQPVRPRFSEKRYLIGRVEQEMRRSKGIVSPEAMQEYERALAYYQSLPVVDDSDAVQKHGRPMTESSASEWLDNAVLHHRFTAEEIRQATGLPLQQAQQQIDARADQPKPNGLRVLPYPGGRHPRSGFLDGAIHPQRETKISVFPPWQDGGYAVVDVPEAIFSNLGLMYLAHTHIPTIWDEQYKQQPLPKREWKKTTLGYRVQRKLPNGIRFASEVTSSDTGAKMQLSLTNGTDKKLTNMRVQVCTMLKGLVGFNVQEELTKVVSAPFVAVRAEPSAGEKARWLITAFQPNHRVWTNPPVPCVHSDPIFPDCEPGQTVTIQGGLWFYEGENVDAEIARLADETNLARPTNQLDR